MAQQRSQHWYGGDDRNAFIHRAWMRRGRANVLARLESAGRLLPAAGPLAVVSRQPRVAENADGY